MIPDETNREQLEHDDGRGIAPSSDEAALRAAAKFIADRAAAFAAAGADVAVPVGVYDDDGSTYDQAVYGPDDDKGHELAR